MSIAELFSQGFLKNIQPSEERVKKSLSTAAGYLAEARLNLKSGAYQSTVLTSYSCIFHAARAVLFRDGVAERSHFAVHDYLQEKHPGLGMVYINGFDMYRKLRHSTAYGLDTVVEEDDAEKAVQFAESFLADVKKYLKIKD